MRDYKFIAGVSAVLVGLTGCFLHTSSVALNHLSSGVSAACLGAFIGIALLALGLVCYIRVTKPVKTKPLIKQSVTVKDRQIGKAA